MFRSDRPVTRVGTTQTRPALTTIYFLLTTGIPGRWHRVASDEAWHFYEGDPLELLSCPPDARSLDRKLLGPIAGEQEAVHVVPADWWQAARTLGTYSLAGCSVGPGFDFADFVMASDLPEQASAVRERLHRFASFL